MGDELPKYARWEHERKFLIPPGLPRPWAVAPSKRISDRYLEVGRLRLRRIEDRGSGEKTFKLGKKFTSDSAWSQPIVNIYLSEDEHESLAVLPGRQLEKLRFHDRFGGLTFSIDVFGGELDGLILCEIEAPTLPELMAIEFPPYARVEVTEDLYFTGGNLCRTTASELEGRLRALSKTEA